MGSAQDTRGHSAGRVGALNELFDLTDALLCADGPVREPVDLTLGG